MQNSPQSIPATQLDTRTIHAYTITRSPTSFQKFNVVAVDRKGELLATVQIDLDLEDAAMMVETLNGDTGESV